MQMATAKRTRRNSFILMISLGLGLGVAMMPNLFEGGGGKSFYAGNLKFNHGFWPEKYTCSEFYTHSRMAAPAKCTSPGGTEMECTGGQRTVIAQPYRQMLTGADRDWTDCQTMCEGLGGTFTEATMTSFEPVAEETYNGLYRESCRDMGGACCSCYDDGKRAFRTAVILMLKTPHCIGFLAAVILNLIMPEDKVDEYSGEAVTSGATVEVEK